MTKRKWFTKGVLIMDAITDNKKVIYHKFIYSGCYISNKEKVVHQRFTSYGFIQQATKKKWFIINLVIMVAVTKTNKRWFITDLLIMAIKIGDKKKWFNSVLFRVVTITATKTWFITVLLVVVTLMATKKLIVPTHPFTLATTTNHQEIIKSR